MEHSKLPWARCAVDGGWDGIMDADGHILFNVVANIPENCDLVTEACNEHYTLKAKEALFEEMVTEMNHARFFLEHKQKMFKVGIAQYDSVLSKAKDLK